MTDEKASKKPQLIQMLPAEELNKSVESSETDGDDGVPLGLTGKAVFMQVRVSHFMIFIQVCHFMIATRSKTLAAWCQTPIADAAEPNDMLQDIILFGAVNHRIGFSMFDKVHARDKRLAPWQPGADKLSVLCLTCI